jgi:hypothetical protein
MSTNWCFRFNGAIVSSMTCTGSQESRAKAGLTNRLYRERKVHQGIEMISGQAHDTKPETVLMDSP